MRGRARVFLVLLGLIPAVFFLSNVGAQHGHPPEPRGVKPPAAVDEDAPIRMTMEELHRSGGTPAGWRFRLPKGDPRAGREVFVKLECFTCHRVEGEKFPRPQSKAGQVGPELTGLGGEHPAEYFFESLIHPNRVITQGPGYSGRDGLSIMPSYNGVLIVEEAVNLVAYLKSLTRGARPEMPMEHKMR